VPDQRLRDLVTVRPLPRFGPAAITLANYDSLVR